MLVRQVCFSTTARSVTKGSINSIKSIDGKGLTDYEKRAARLGTLYEKLGGSTTEVKKAKLKRKNSMRNTIPKNFSMEESIINHTDKKE